MLLGNRVGLYGSSPAPLPPLTLRFALHIQAGVLSSAEGLHNLRKSLEDEWFIQTLPDRCAIH